MSKEHSVSMPTSPPYVSKEGYGVPGSQPVLTPQVPAEETTPTNNQPPRASHPLAKLAVAILLTASAMVYSEHQPTRRAVDQTLGVLTYSPDDCPDNWQGQPVSDPELIARSFGTVYDELGRRELYYAAHPLSIDAIPSDLPGDDVFGNPAWDAAMDEDRQRITESMIQLSFEGFGYRTRSNPIIYDDPAESTCEQPNGQFALNPDAQDLYNDLSSQTDLRIDFKTGVVTPNN